MEKAIPPAELSLTIDPRDISFYTTLLQSGIEIKCPPNEPVARFLNRLPGFTVDYIADIVQTIFLDGTAVDDLTTPLSGKKPVLALSAAMPGLAGAIFRRNSFHAALRTIPDKKNSANRETEKITVTLKLFNSIAFERGEALLRNSITIKTGHLLNYLAKRPSLFSQIKQCVLSGKTVPKEELSSLLANIPRIKLTMIRS
ncbi:hypothetical protein [Desulfomarina sp.]